LKNNKGDNSNFSISDADMDKVVRQLGFKGSMPVVKKPTITKAQVDKELISSLEDTKKEILCADGNIADVEEIDKIIHKIKNSDMSPDDYVDVSMLLLNIADRRIRELETHEVKNVKVPVCMLYLTGDDWYTPYIEEYDHGIENLEEEDDNILAYTLCASLAKKMAEDMPDEPCDEGDYLLAISLLPQIANIMKENGQLDEIRKLIENENNDDDEDEGDEDNDE
jgi:hypothetical protein